jgi:hypothetical protein
LALEAAGSAAGPGLAIEIVAATATEIAAAETGIVVVDSQTAASVSRSATMLSGERGARVVD